MLGAAAYLKDVAMAVTKNGLGKAMNVSFKPEMSFVVFNTNANYSTQSGYRQYSPNCIQSVT